MKKLILLSMVLGIGVVNDARSDDYSTYLRAINKANPKKDQSTINELYKKAINDPQVKSDLPAMEKAITKAGFNFATAKAFATSGGEPGPTPPVPPTPGPTPPDLKTAISVQVTEVNKSLDKVQNQFALLKPDADYANFAKSMETSARAK